MLGHALRTLIVLGAALSACTGSSSSVSGSSGASGSGGTGSGCSAATSCYAGTDAAALHGTVQCLTQVTGGYCTHTCQTDADCCTVASECNGFPEVCSPLESSSGTQYCFLSCEAASIASAPNQSVTDPTQYCQKYANASFGCRSTGGGSKNRHVCLP